MEQMNVDQALKVDIDFNDEVLPKSAKEIQPLVYKNDNGFCCLLGPNLTEGIVGYGETPLLSIVDWETNLTTRLSLATEDDLVIQYVKDVYKAGNTEVW